MKTRITLLLLLIACSVWGQNPFKKRQFLPNTVKEISGLCLINKDSILAINDSGDQPIIYYLNAAGQVYNQVLLSQIQNKDWEALATDGSSIFIADFGNNCNCRTDLKIYQIHSSGQIDSFRIVLPDQKVIKPSRPWMNYDIESLAYSHGSLHFFSKNKMRAGNYYSKHYQLELEKPQTIELRDSFQFPDLVVTGAAFNPTGDECLVISYDFKLLLGFFPRSKTRLYHFYDFDDGAVFSGKSKAYRIGFLPIITQFESVDWIDDQHALIASERTGFIPARMKKIKLKR